MPTKISGRVLLGFIVFLASLSAAEMRTEATVNSGVIFAPESATFQPIVASSDGQGGYCALENDRIVLRKADGSVIEVVRRGTFKLPYTLRGKIDWLTCDKGVVYYNVYDITKSDSNLGAAGTLHQWTESTGTSRVVLKPFTQYAFVNAIGATENTVFVIPYAGMAKAGRFVFTALVDTSGSGFKGPNGSNYAWRSFELLRNGTFRETIDPFTVDRKGLRLLAMNVGGVTAASYWTSSPVLGNAGLMSIFRTDMKTGSLRTTVIANNAVAGFGGTVFSDDSVVVAYKNSGGQIRLIRVDDSDVGSLKSSDLAPTGMIDSYPLSNILAHAFGNNTYTALMSVGGNAYDLFEIGKDGVGRHLAKASEMPGGIVDVFASGPNRYAFSNTGGLGNNRQVWQLLAPRLVSANVEAAAGEVAPVCMDCSGPTLNSRVEVANNSIPVIDGNMRIPMSLRPGRYPAHLTVSSVSLPDFTLTVVSRIPPPRITQVSSFGSADAEPLVLAPGKYIVVSGMDCAERPKASDNMSLQVDGLYATVLPDKLNGSRLLMNGEPVGLLSSSTASNGVCQLTGVVPYTVQPGKVELVVERQLDGFRSEPLSFTVEATAPAVCKTPDGYPVVYRPDHSPVSGDNPAKAGEILSFSLTGSGATGPDGNVLAPIRITLNGNELPSDAVTIHSDQSGIETVQLNIPPETESSESGTLAIDLFIGNPEVATSHQQLVINFVH